jgi:HEPN domain-containing protein
VRQEVERLVLQARRDLRNARRNIGVEKYLKAAWIQKKRVRPRPTHYLRELGQGLRVPKHLMAHLIALNADYTVARYPDAANGVPYELYDESIAAAKVKAAEEVARWCESLIRS